VADINLDNGLFLLDTVNGNVEMYSGDISLVANDSLNLLSTSDLQVTSATATVTTGNLEGLVYTDDYSATFVNNSLVSKFYVDSVIDSATSNITSYLYEIGQYGQCGIIFHRYKDGGEEYYLEVDIEDLSTSEKWSNVESTLIGSSAQSSWNGASNSVSIINQLGHTGSAAKLCDDKLSGYNDWYLPSFDELSLLWQNRFNVNRTLSGNSYIGSIVGAYEIGPNSYWSSTELNSNLALPFDFASGGLASTLQKGAFYRVRAIRKFNTN
jgi:hypothetical protein